MEGNVNQCFNFFTKFETITPPPSNSSMCYTDHKVPDDFQEYNTFQQDVGQNSEIKLESPYFKQQQQQPPCQDFSRSAIISATNFPEQNEKKQRRTMFTSTQLLELEKQYSKGAYLTKLVKINLASSLKLSERQVKIWFQNRRMKDKKIGKNHYLPSSNEEIVAETSQLSLENEHKFTPVGDHQKQMMMVPDMTQFSLDLNRKMHSSMSTPIPNVHFQPRMFEQFALQVGNNSNVRPRYFNVGYPAPQPMASFQNMSTNSMYQGYPTRNEQAASGHSRMKIETDLPSPNMGFYPNPCPRPPYNEPPQDVAGPAQLFQYPESTIDLMGQEIPKTIEDMFQPADFAPPSTPSVGVPVQAHCPLNGLMSITKFVQENPDAVRQMIISEGDEIEKKTIRELREFLKL